MILFIFRHPFWILFILCLIAGGATYYPLSRGVKPEEVISWYQEKYQDIKFQVVTKAVESGETDFVPQALVDEVAKAKKKMEEEKLEAGRPKSENYNENIARDKKVEAVKQDLKKRKSGFKKKEDMNGEAENAPDISEQGADNLASPQSDDLSIDIETLSAGGLAGVFSSEAEEQKGEASVNVVPEDGNVSGPTFIEKNEEEVLEHSQDLLQKDEPLFQATKEQTAEFSDLEAVEIPMLPVKEDKGQNSGNERVLPAEKIQHPEIKSDNLGNDDVAGVSEKSQQNVEENKIPTLLPNKSTSDDVGGYSEVEKETSSQAEDDVFSDEEFNDLELF